MKKFLLLIAVVSLVCSTADALGKRDVMEKVLTSWYGENIDTVINKWGYPTDEKNIAGKKLLLWSQGTEHSIDSWGDKDDGWNWGTVKDEEICTRILEVDAHNKVIHGDWRGESCPMTPFGGKKWANPQNNPWAN